MPYKTTCAAERSRPVMRGPSCRWVTKSSRSNSAKESVGEGLSVRDTERLVQEKIELEDNEKLSVFGGTEKKRKRRARSEQVVSLEQELRVALGTKVDIRNNSRGRGQIVIHFRNNDEFERLRSILSDRDDDAQSYVG